MVKTKTITFSFPHHDPNVQGGRLYRVERLTNSVDFAPRQLVTKKEVDELCSARDWTVTCIPNLESLS